MPTILSDDEHPSLSSLPPNRPLAHMPSPPHTPQTQQHYHHRFPSHFHPSYSSQLQHLQQQVPPQSPPSTSTSLPRRPSLPSGARFRVTATTTAPPSAARRAKTRSQSAYKQKHPFTPSPRLKQQPSSNHQKHYNQGPKWIHRQGLINGINYHWVETTGRMDDEVHNIKPTDKPLVILLHGFPQFWYTWRHQIVPLADAGYRVVAPDLRGFNLTDKPTCPKRKNGHSSGGTATSSSSSSKGKKDDRQDANTEQPEAAYDIETLTSDIRALMQYLEHDEAHIVGHDWGGIIAWAFAARFPRHTSKLVVMNAPHLCRWRDVAMDYSSASCFEQTWWTCWYTLCCQLLPSWIPETVLSYQRSWILTYNMTSAPAYSNPLSCISTSAKSLTDSTTLNFACAEPNSANIAEGFAAPGGGGCAACWKQTDMDLYRDAISKPGAIYSLLEYYRNLWLSVQQMEQYGKIRRDLPILVLWGNKDRNFPKEVYAKGWEAWIENDEQFDQSHSDQSASSLTVEYLDCGHFTPEEAPADVNRHLLDFFGCPVLLRADTY